MKQIPEEKWDEVMNIVFELAEKYGIEVTESSDGKGHLFYKNEEGSTEEITDMGAFMRDCLRRLGEKDDSPIITEASPASRGIYEKHEEEKQMEDTVAIEFSGEDFDFIMKYAQLTGAATVQEAVMNAIRFLTYRKNFT